MLYYVSVGFFLSVYCLVLVAVNIVLPKILHGSEMSLVYGINQLQN